MLRMSREPSISETQGGPGTHCCPRKGVGRRTLPTAFCSALLICSPVLLLRGKGRPQRTKAGEDRCRAGRALLAALPWSHQKHFFFLVRETRPPWQSADTLETHKDRRAEGSTKKRGKGERKQKKVTVAQAQTPEPLREGPGPAGSGGTSAQPQRSS